MKVRSYCSKLRLKSSSLKQSVAVDSSRKADQFVEFLLVTVVIDVLVATSIRLVFTPTHHEI